jgi:hypothetical protein
VISKYAFYEKGRIIKKRKMRKNRDKFLTPKLDSKGVKFGQKGEKLR